MGGDSSQIYEKTKAIDVVWVNAIYPDRLLHKSDFRTGSYVSDLLSAWVKPKTFSFSLLRKFLQKAWALAHLEML